MKIGIDIGTSYSCASVIDGEGKAKPIELSTAVSMYGDKYSLPSAIFVEDNGNILVGQAAMNNRIIKPERFIMEFKRLIGQSTPVYLGDKEFLPEDLYTELFRHIKRMAEETCGEAVDKAYITYPAAFLETKKAKIKAAAQRAGLFNVELVDEPTSAAMCYYAAGELKEGQTVLIYDFGGGTFDAALVKYEGGSFTLPTGALGLEHCGGIDIDRAILRSMRDAVDQEQLESLPEKYAMRLNGQLAEKAVKAKHQLTAAESFSDSIFIGMDDFPYELSRDKLEGMIARLAGNTVELCRELLKNAGMEVSDLAGIVMVGGTSRIPLVRRMVEQFAGGASVLHSLDPELAVCQGAVLYDECTAGSDDQGSTSDIPLAELIKKASESDAEAQYMLGKRYIDEWSAYLSNELIEYDEDTARSLADNAVKWYTKAAENNHPEAQSFLGMSYEEGIYGCQKNQREAEKWYRKAAEQGSADGQYELGRFYYTASGEMKNYAEAIVWYRKAAGQGHAEAQRMLGRCYLYGKGIEKSCQEADAWYRIAAEQGSAEAMCDLGKLYYEEKKLYTEAVVWFKKAAEQNNAHAQYMLGRCYHDGTGAPKNTEEAVKWYRRAAERGNTRAQRILISGKLPYDNINVEWLKNAAEHGDDGAQYMLGKCYFNGFGVAQDKYEAVKWLRRATDKGNAEAEYMLGECYLYGHGVKNKSPEKALAWYKKAAEQGHQEAKDKLENIGFGY